MSLAYGIFGDQINPFTSSLTTAQLPLPPQSSYPPVSANMSANLPAQPPALPGSGQGVGMPLPPPRPPLSLASPGATGVGAGPMPAPGSMPPGATAGGFGNPFGGMMGNGLNNHALTLMALGAGIAQGGIGRGLEATTSVAQAERNRQLQQLSFVNSYNALTSAGVPPQQAQAAISNPSMMRAIAGRYLGARAPGGGMSRGAAPTNVPPATMSRASASAASSSPTATAPGGTLPTPAPVSLSLEGLGQSNSGNRAPASAPTLPPNVPNGSHYSPSRNMWRDSTGNLFDARGQAVH